MTEILCRSRNLSNDDSIMKKHTISVLAIIATGCFVLCGCGEGVIVRGTVQFEDGNPLSVGTVVFSGEKGMYRGYIKSDGKFSLGITKNNQRIPKGDYRVSIVGATRETGETRRTGGGVLPIIEIPVEELLIDSIYTDPATSGLSFQVPSANYDLTVTPPPLKR